MTQLATDFQECDVGGKGRLTLAEYKAMVGRHEVRATEKGLYANRDEAHIERSWNAMNRLNSEAEGVTMEDINIAGAQGILVNVTAGLDLAIGELDDVGTAITELASPDANVVVGTVIDSNMTDGELRVTMVATGLGKDKLLADAPVAPVQPESNGEVDYKKLERPTAIRKKIVGDTVEVPEDKESMEYLEIPAFLRRQAD